MLATIKTFLQVATILCFMFLACVGILEKDWNVGVGMNVALVLVYIFIYLQPFNCN